MVRNSVIDLFAGCGGFSSGFKDAGFNIIKAVEFDSQIAQTYKKNHLKTQVIIDDIKNIDNLNYFKKNECNIIIGGPPCQGFSMAGARIRDGFLNDPRNYLFKHYLNIVSIVLPDIFIMENVKGIMTMDNGDIFKQIINAFENIDKSKQNMYNIYYKVLNAKDFGIPQARERVVVIGVKNKGIDINNMFNKAKENISKIHPYFFNKVTLWDALSNLNPATLDGKVENMPPITAYQKYLHDPNKQYIINHIATKHNKIAITRMMKIRTGENWTSLNEPIKSIHSGSYGRLDKNGVAPTITTRFDTPSGGKFIHPTENRTITPREAARIQSFKDSFTFYGNKTSICKQVGNAVPPKIGYFLAEVAKLIQKS